ncbi:MAG: polymer-forming cytoskeletal protein [Acidobacteriota bacterium]
MAKDEINAFLGVGTTYRGRLDFTGSVRIDGVFEGEIESEGTLVVGREAVITGQVRVGSLVLGGTLNGDATASQRALLHKTARFKGVLSTPALSVEEGAELDGQVCMCGSGLGQPQG